MKKVNTAEMRNTAGGYRCRKCKKFFLMQWTAGYHILFHPGHYF